MAKFAVTYWQSFQYQMTVDTVQLIPAVRYYAEKASDPSGRIAQTLADLEAGRVPSDLAILADALEADGQLVVADRSAEPDASDEPGDYNVEVVPG